MSDEKKNAQDILDQFKIAKPTENVTDFDPFAPSSGESESSTKEKASSSVDVASDLQDLAPSSAPSQGADPSHPPELIQ